MNEDYIIYVISLREDSLRRELMVQKFPAMSAKFNYIEAVDGRKINSEEYFHTMLSHYQRRERLISPTELGCALSHISALRQFLASPKRFALILEDDISGNDEAIRKILQITPNLDDDSIFICGGQEGLPSRNYLIGDRTPISHLYKLSKFSYEFIMRTCCYTVTRQTAKLILSKQESNISIADDWKFLLHGEKVNVYLANLLQHPTDLSDSKIERERALSRSQIARKRTKIFSKLFLATSKLSRIFCHKIMILLGRTKIPSSS